MQEDTHATMLNLPLLDPEDLRLSAAKHLSDGGEVEAARTLCACSLHLDPRYDPWDGGIYRLHITLAGPREAYELLCNEQHPVRQAVERALTRVLPPKCYLHALVPRGEIVRYDPEARVWLSEAIISRHVRNQGITIDIEANNTVARWHAWQGLRFRTPGEVEIAEALDRTGVLFLPLPAARVSYPEGRRTREPDFLVCKDGHWGILEVDGPVHDLPWRADDDRKRDQMFRRHGVRVLKRHSDNRCKTEPEVVVQEFLALLQEV